MTFKMSRPISPLYPREDEPMDEEDLLQQDEEGRKVLNFREPREFYNEMCKSQLAEARLKMGKNWVENLQRTNLVRPTFKDDLPRPDNYKKLCELQLEEIRQSEHYQKLNTMDKIRRVVEGPKQYLCSKCGQPKKGHSCKASAGEVDEKGVVIARRRTKEDLSRDDGDDKGRSTLSRKRSRSSFTDGDGDGPHTRRSRGVNPHDPRKFLSHFPPEYYKMDWKNKHLKIIVVGAGISGLTAARELRNIGYDVTVIEARDRIGGRIHTITSDDLKSGFGVDIGASFLYSVDKNPFADLCRELGVPLHNFGNSVVLYDANGKQISSALETTVEHVFNQFLDEIARVRNKPCYFSRRRLIRGHFDRHQDRPVHDNIKPSTTFIEDTSLGKTINDSLLQWQKRNNTISNESWAALNWQFANIEGMYGADLSLLSQNNWDIDDGSPVSEGDSCLLYQGFGHIINHLSQGLDVRLGHKVEQIVYDPSQKVRVETSKGSIEGDFVICTLPLGILKEGSVQFNPPLPQDKLTAINTLGFGLINKLILFFPTVFWDKNADFIGSAGQGSENRGEFYVFINMDKVVGSPILVALIGGQAALTLENRSGEEVVTQAMKLLNKIYGSNATSPTRAVVTRWAGDPFARGAFSYLPVGSTGNEYDVLAKPVLDRLYFAGEATQRQYPSTVTGAYLSGTRVAVEVARRCTEVSPSSPMQTGTPISSQLPLNSSSSTISSPANLLLSNTGSYNPGSPAIHTPPPPFPGTFSPTSFDGNNIIMDQILQTGYSFRHDLIEEIDEQV